MTTDSTPEERVRSGETWSDFCKTLERAGDQILRPSAPDSTLDRAEGFRYLTRLLRIALEMHLEFADQDFPGFFSPSHETAKIGADNPDNLYHMARVNPDHDYVVEGTRGTVSYVSMGSQKGGYESDGSLQQTGFIDDADLTPDADDFISVIASQNPQPGQPWLPMDADTNTVLVRETFQDRSSEQPAQLSIRRRDPGVTPEPLSAQRLDANLANVGQFVEGTARIFTDWAEYLQANTTNELPPADQAFCQHIGGDPNIFYYHGHWRLAADEALVIHVSRIPECRFWNIQIDNFWMESLDYRYLRITLNDHSAMRDADGGVTMILSHTDPGHPNWLQTGGHDNGTMSLRWVGSDEQVHPTTQVRKLAELSV